MTVAKLIRMTLACALVVGTGVVLGACAGGAAYGECQTSAACSPGVCVDGRCTVPDPITPDGGPDHDSDPGRDVDAARGCLDDPDQCSDGIDCTVDDCRTDEGCSHAADHELCGAEKLCNPTRGCVDSPTCAEDSTCDDGDPCNGVERCVDSRCGASEAPSCDDHDVCTVDGCDPANEAADRATGCFHAPLDEDGDGHVNESCAGDDCDDTRASVHGGAPELCDELDQDCDGEIDEALACLPGEQGECTSVCGTSGTRSCTDSCSWDDCEPPLETCNGVDDDCDGAVDDGFLCPQSVVMDCNTECGSAGRRTCTDACTWGACVPPAEVCNGIDDDCNGACDDGEGFACCLGARNIPCTTRCGTEGLGECVGGCEIDCRAIEACNGCDDDSDLIVDEGGVCDGENCANPVVITTPSTIITRSTCGRMNDDSPATVANCGSGYGSETPDVVILVVPPGASTAVTFTLISASFNVQWAITRGSCDTGSGGSFCVLDSQSLSGNSHYFVHVSGHSPGACGTFTLAVTW